MIIKRRKFIFAVASSLGATYLGYEFFLGNIKPKLRMSGSTDAITNLQELVENEPWFQQIGERYLEKKTSSYETADAINKDLTLGLKRTKAESFLDKLEELIISDFKNNKLCQIDDWSLSETECRIGAYSILSGIKHQVSEDPINHYRDENLLGLVNWGPRKSEKGQSFNIQRNGWSSLWFTFDSVDNEKYQIFFGNQPMKTKVQQTRNRITASLHPTVAKSLTSQPGVTPIRLVDTRRATRQFIGNFKIFSQNSEKTNPIRISRWGPKSTTVGRGFNLQPNGHSAFFVRTEGTHWINGEYVIELDGVRFKTGTRERVITASIAPDKLSHLIDAPKKLPLRLIELKSGRIDFIGNFSVNI
tara:strand:- start:548 stop:1627 length:1080 start_codon:yes stop_codon:yes gene_type:complete